MNFVAGLENSRDKFELLLFISAPVRTEFHCEVYATVLTKHIFSVCTAV